MPKGQYDRTGKTSKDDIKNFVKFCFREDVAEKLFGKLLFFSKKGRKKKEET